MKIESAIYNGYAKATGGREGYAVSSDGALNVKLSTPKELGGAGGDGTNPEQMFAAGYSACFLGALRFVAGQEKLKLSDDSTVSARVGIGSLPDGFGIEVDITVELPDIDQTTAKMLAEKAHVVCPYSNATRGNINVNFEIV